MKKIHIVLLVLIAGAIAFLISNFNLTSTTYDSIADARSNPGKFLHIAVKLDTLAPIEYDPIKNANYLSFQAVDVEKPDQKMQVVYRRGEIPNLRISERIILKGKYENGYFECHDVQTKCPSKYKDDPRAIAQGLDNATGSQPAKK